MQRRPFDLQRVSGLSVTDDQLLADLRRVAEMLGKRTVGQKHYGTQGGYDDTTVSRRFGSWNLALRAAGLDVSNEPGLSDEMLFKMSFTLVALWATATPE